MLRDDTSTTLANMALLVSRYAGVSARLTFRANLAATLGNRGNSWRTDSSGTITDNHGNSWRIDGSGVAWDNYGNSCRKDNNGNFWCNPAPGQ